MTRTAADIADSSAHLPTDKNGFIKWRQYNVLISGALKHLHVELDAKEDGTWDVRWDVDLARSS